MTIKEIIDSYPETRDVFVAHGFAEFADEEVLKQLGLFLKLKTALRSKGIDAASFHGLLEDKIAEKKSLNRLAAKVMDGGAERFNMVSLLPCPLKVPLQNEMQSFLEDLREKKGLSLNYFIDAFFNHHLHYDEYLDYAEDADELPDIIFTAGFSFYFKKFIERFVSKGVFAKGREREIHPRLLPSGIVDPDGHFIVVAVNTLVMVVDKKRLGDLPVPQSWSDILKPEYQNRVVIRGHEDVFCDIVQLNIYRDYGADGVRKLGRSVCCGWHPSQMVKGLMSSDPDIPPIHVMPYFFYKTIHHCPDVSVVWPAEGVLTYPVSMLIKEDKMDEFREVVDYLTGKHVAAVCANAFFPAVHPEVEVRLPEEVRFKWIGWDFIKNHDMQTLTEEVNEIFLREYIKTK